MSFFDAEGATPLDPGDLRGLIPEHVTTQNQLNEWEHANILQAEKWAYTRKHRDVLSISFIRLLHEKMFDKTWHWAGEFPNQADQYWCYLASNSCPAKDAMRRFRILFVEQNI